MWWRQDGALTHGRNRTMKGQVLSSNLWMRKEGEWLRGFVVVGFKEHTQEVSSSYSQSPRGRGSSDKAPPPSRCTLGIWLRDGLSDKAQTFLADP